MPWETRGHKVGQNGRNRFICSSVVQKGYLLPFRAEARNLFATGASFPFLLTDVTAIRISGARK
jgi:hypothetical protein